jgi:hypothetical protein
LSKRARIGSGALKLISVAGLYIVIFPVEFRYNRRSRTV